MKKEKNGVLKCILDSRDFFWGNCSFLGLKKYPSNYTTGMLEFNKKIKIFRRYYYKQNGQNQKIFSLYRASITAQGPGLLHIIDGRLTGQCYVQLLNDVIRSSVKNRLQNNLFSKM